MGSLDRKVCCFGQSKIFCRDIVDTEKAPKADEDIDKKKADGSYELTEAERKRRKDSGRQMAMHT